MHPSDHHTGLGSAHLCPYLNVGFEQPCSMLPSHVTVNACKDQGCSLLHNKHKVYTSYNNNIHT